MSAEALDNLARARAAFDQWRSRSSGRGRTPSQLWALALALVGTHGVAAVARELGLNPGRPRARFQHDATPAPRRRAAKPRFVELEPIALVSSAKLGASAATATHLEVGARIRVDRCDGASFTLDLAPDRLDLVERLLTAFAHSAS